MDLLEERVDKWSEEESMWDDTKMEILLDVCFDL